MAHRLVSPPKRGHSVTMIGSEDENCLIVDVEYYLPDFDTWAVVVQVPGDLEVGAYVRASRYGHWQQVHEPAVK